MDPDFQFQIPPFKKKKNIKYPGVVLQEGIPSPWNNHSHPAIQTGWWDWMNFAYFQVKAQGAHVSSAQNPKTIQNQWHSPLNPGWLIGILFWAVWNNLLNNWGRDFHPLSNPTTTRGPEMISGPMCFFHKLATGPAAPLLVLVGWLEWSGRGNKKRHTDRKLIS